MKIIKRLLPVTCVIAVIVGLFIWLYSEMTAYEQERCWNDLRIAAQDTRNSISTKIRDEIEKLQVVKSIMEKESMLTAEEISRLHLDVFRPTTLFSRIDILFSDNTFLSEGAMRTLDKEIDFARIAEKGEYITHRKVDSITGKQCVYYVLPVMKQETVRAVLIGMIEPETLSELFRPLIYDGQIQLCIIDAVDGNYIMDSWHDELGNAYEPGERRRLKEYEDFDWRASVRNLETTVYAFYSQTTGKPIYMYFEPIKDLNWQLLIFGGEDVLFAELYHMRSLLTNVGAMMLCLLLLYFLWNLQTVMQLENSLVLLNEQREQLTRLSYRDALSSMCNRNKYAEVMQLLRGQQLDKVGVVYADLNGLKHINDTLGHDQGDRYICGAARALTGAFTEDSYRIGGDEFVVLAVGMEQAEFRERFHALETLSAQEKVSISCGVLWEEHCTDLEELIQSAERVMYESKETYYQTHGGRRTDAAEGKGA